MFFLWTRCELLQILSLIQELYRILVSNLFFYKSHKIIFLDNHLTIWGVINWNAQWIYQKLGKCYPEDIQYICSLGSAMNYLSFQRFRSINRATIPLNFCFTSTFPSPLLILFYLFLFCLHLISDCPVVIAVFVNLVL